MALPYYEICLPLPPSVNAMHTIGRGFRNPKTGKMQRVKARSAEYKSWVEYAGTVYRKKFPSGVLKLEGRLRADYIFCWHKKDRGRNSSDISNREKCLSDFLEKKFFENDNQIDEQHHYRRFVEGEKSYVLCRIYQTPDRRLDDVGDIFK